MQLNALVALHKFSCIHKVIFFFYDVCTDVCKSECGFECISALVMHTHTPVPFIESRPWQVAVFIVLFFFFFFNSDRLQNANHSWH